MNKNERKRDREREKERDRDRETERETDIKKDRERNVHYWDRPGYSFLTTFWINIIISLWRQVVVPNVLFPFSSYGIL